jgi:hypothetical protein
MRVRRHDVNMMGTYLGVGGDADAFNHSVIEAEMIDANESNFRCRCR